MVLENEYCPRQLLLRREESNLNPQDIFFLRNLTPYLQSNSKRS